MVSRANSLADIRSTPIQKDFDRDWKKIEAFVGSKTCIIIRSLKVQKNGTSEHLPPPRPKRKAAHPYPQKACKNSQGISPACQIYHHPYKFQVISKCQIHHLGAPSLVLLCYAISSWNNNSAQTVNLSNETKVLPDFSQVYSFIGSVFDPNTTGHVQKLKNMDQIDVETVCFLQMKCCKVA
ncbi:protein REVEILLE 3-like [Humulus lupulus]|uniref:protein REVEILLE 3-like n=1 Tax=Humulus lupulus TaxID=3486 RepID=UPI002B400B9F|nr:protein REVEILLE 3-like [Humulus lupulus]